MAAWNLKKIPARMTARQRDNRRIRLGERFERTLYGGLPAVLYGGPYDPRRDGGPHIWRHTMRIPWIAVSRTVLLGQRRSSVLRTLFPGYWQHEREVAKARQRRER